MKFMTTNVKITNLASIAIKQTAEELNEKYGADSIHGFALCTDDAVGSIFPAVCTKAWIAEEKPDYEEIGEVYVEWTEPFDETPFDDLSNLLCDACINENEEEFGKRRDERFGALVEALRQSRDRVDFKADVLLCIGSTDPEDRMEELTMKAVDALNLKHVADKFASSLGYEHHR